MILTRDPLPPGVILTWDAWLYGMPTKAGTFRFTVAAINTIGSTPTPPTTVTIAPDPRRADLSISAPASSRGLVHGKTAWFQVHGKNKDNIDAEAPQHSRLGLR